jgi:hypothetical protein
MQQGPDLMAPTTIALIVVLVLAGGMVLWAVLTGGEGPRQDQLPKHAQWTGEGSTTRLHHPGHRRNPDPPE